MRVSSKKTHPAPLAARTGHRRAKSPFLAPLTVGGSLGHPKTVHLAYALCCSLYPVILWTTLPLRLYENTTSSPSQCYDHLLGMMLAFFSFFHVSPSCLVTRKWPPSYPFHPAQLRQPSRPMQPPSAKWQAAATVAPRSGAIGAETMSQRDIQRLKSWE